MNQKQKKKIVNEMKALRIVNEIITLAEKCKADLYNDDFLDAHYDMNLISRGSVFALEAIYEVCREDKN